MTPRFPTTPGNGADGAVRRVALLAVHTSPLAQPGTGDGGGLNVFVLQTARRLAARGVQVDVFTRRADPEQPATEHLADRLELHRLDTGRPGPMTKHDLASRLCAFVNALQRHPTAGTHDVIHAHYWLSGWVARRLRPVWEIPFVQTFHTIGALKNQNLAPGDTPEPALRLVAEGRIAADADRLAVLTCGEARIVHETFGVSGARIGVVPAGVDLDAFDPVGPVAVEADGDGPLLLFVGRLQPLKGPDVAVRTLARVRAEVPDARLVVLGGTSGSGDGRTGPAQLRSLAEQLGVADGLSLHPPVPQEELAAWYRAADVLLAPSRSETFGLVALEAQACGTPVVAADVPGLRATVRAGGLLVEGHDPADHGAAVLRVLQDEAVARRLCDGGLAFAASTTWDNTVDRLLDCYAEAVAFASPLALAG